MNNLITLSHTLNQSPRMPVLFVGHGNPMNAILDNEISRTWKQIGHTLPPAQAFVIISAHWYTKGTHITDAPKQAVIYDMYGFPDELYKVSYEAQGSPDVAEQLRRAFVNYEAKLDSSWGLDHGTWSVLTHMAPDPKIPVLQISMDVDQSLTSLMDMFRLLRPLREKGVIFIGSGNLVHNLSRLNFHDSTVFDWAAEFDQKAANAISSHNLQLLSNPAKISKAAELAVEFDDHYRPMLAAMSLLHPSEQITYFNSTIDMGSISMRSFITH